jgi:hypothetical protein
MISLVKTCQSRTISINLEQLRNYLLTTPLEFTSQSASNINLLQLPMPDGSMMDFDMEESPMLEPGLAAQFPDIKTYSGHGIKDKTAYLKISITAKGFHAMILSAQGSFYIDPYNWQNTNYGIVYSKENFDPNSKPRMECKLGDISTQSLLQSIPQNAFATQPTIQFGDCQRRNFRLALAATGEFKGEIGILSDEEPADFVDFVCKLFDRSSSIIGEIFEALGDFSTGVLLEIIDCCGTDTCL